MKMATQSQGIKQLMAAEKEAAHVVTNARKSEFRARGSRIIRQKRILVHAGPSLMRDKVGP